MLVLAAGAVVAVACTTRAPSADPSRVDRGNGPEAPGRLPTGVHLDPAGRSIGVGNMPTAALLSPDGRYMVLSLSGWRTQGIEVVDRASGKMVQQLKQPGAFIGMAWSSDAHTLYVSGGMSEMIYAYGWSPSRAQPAVLADSFGLGRQDSVPAGSRYAAGIALAHDGRTLYVAENLSDSIAVIDLAAHRVIQRVATGPYPYGIVVSPDGLVYASAWGASYVNVYHTGPGGQLVSERPIDVARHPSALLLNADGTRLFVASASTDRIAVVDTRARHLVRLLRDPPPDGVTEGSTPDALALSADESRLYVAEADANAVAVFDLSAQTSGRAASRGADSLTGRIPVEWYP
ncbi:MAG: YncE family protein, partial [Gemmatimonadaceae bacterium]